MKTNWAQRGAFGRDENLSQLRYSYNKVTGVNQAERQTWTLSSRTLVSVCSKDQISSLLTLPLAWHWNLVRGLCAAPLIVYGLQEVTGKG